MGNRYILLVMLMAVLIGCSTNKDTIRLKEYKAQVEDENNGLKKDVGAGELVYSFQYKPALYIAASENAWKADSAKMKSRANQLKNTIWFNISIKSKDGNDNPLKLNAIDMTDYNARLNYFLTEASRHISLTYGGMEVPQLGYFFENNYGLIPADVMVVGFKIPDSIPCKDVAIVYDDVLFNNGLLKMKIAKEDFAHIQNLQVIL